MIGLSSDCTIDCSGTKVFVDASAKIVKLTHESCDHSTYHDISPNEYQQRKPEKMCFYSDFQDRMGWKFSDLETIIMDTIVADNYEFLCKRGVSIGWFRNIVSESDLSGRITPEQFKSYVNHYLFEKEGRLTAERMTELRAMNLNGHELGEIPFLLNQPNEKYLHQLFYATVLVFLERIKTNQISPRDCFKMFSALSSEEDARQIFLAFDGSFEPLNHNNAQACGVVIKFKRFRYSERPEVQYFERNRLRYDVAKFLKGKDLDKIREETFPIFKFGTAELGYRKALEKEKDKEVLYEALHGTSYFKLAKYLDWLNFSDVCADPQEFFDDMARRYGEPIAKRVFVLINGNETIPTFIDKCKVCRQIGMYFRQARKKKNLPALMNKIENRLQEKAHMENKEFIPVTRYGPPPKPIRQFYFPVNTFGNIRKLQGKPNAIMYYQAIYGTFLTVRERLKQLGLGKVYPNIEAFVQDIAGKYGKEIATEVVREMNKAIYANGDWLHVQRKNIDKPKWLDEVLTKVENLENWIMSLDEKVLAKEKEKWKFLVPLSYSEKKPSAAKNDTREELACLSSDRNVEIDAKQTTKATVTSNDHHNQFIGSSAMSKSMKSNIATSDTSKPPAKTEKARSTSNKKRGNPNHTLPKNALHDLNPNTVRKAPKRRMLHKCPDGCDPEVFYAMSPQTQLSITRNPEAHIQSLRLPEQEIAYHDPMSSLQDCRSCKLGEDTTTNDTADANPMDSDYEEEYGEESDGLRGPGSDKNIQAIKPVWNESSNSSFSSRYMKLDMQQYKLEPRKRNTTTSFSSRDYSSSSDDNVRDPEAHIQSLGLLEGSSQDSDDNKGNISNVTSRNKKMDNDVSMLDTTDEEDNDKKEDVGDDEDMKDEPSKDSSIIDLCSASEDEDTSNNVSYPTEIVNSEDDSIEHESESEEDFDESLLDEDSD